MGDKKAECYSRLSFNVSIHHLLLSHSLADKNNRRLVILGNQLMNVFSQDGKRGLNPYLLK